MSKFEELAMKIEEVRTLMNEIIRETSELIDPEVVHVSQYLDKLLNEYYDLLEKR